jgi:K+:H+ antiporter subunit KhtU
VTLLALSTGADAAVLLELGALFLALALLARLSDRLGVSAVPFYLVVGVAFGEGGLVGPAFSERFIEAAGAIGVVLLLFTLGLEYTAADLQRGLRGGLPNGTVDFLLNFPPGFVAGLLLGWPSSAAFVLGGVTYISSSGIVAKVLGDLRRMGNPETPAVLSLLVFEDLAMAIYLPVLAVLLSGATPFEGVVDVTIALAVVLGALYLALRHGPLLTRLLAARSDEAVLLSVFGLTLLVAGAAETVQVSAAIGAFLVGVAISGSLGARTLELVRPLRDLFAAAFFFLFGLRIDPGEIPPVLVVAVVLALLTAGTKYVTGTIAARRARLDGAAQQRAGTILIARGEFSIVIAGLAVAAGTEPRLGALCGTYVLLLAAAGPIVTRFAGRSS